MNTVPPTKHLHQIELAAVSPRAYTLIRMFCSAFLLACLLIFIIKTWRWPLIGDAALMHYVVFLMHHGMAPYRNIVDPNLPTTLVIESAVIHLFGGGSLAWRLFDLFILAMTGIAMTVIARTDDASGSDWFACLFAASLFALIHARDGTMQLGQRDLTMTALLVIAYAFLFEALRPHTHRKIVPWLIALFGLFAAAAATIKPTVLLLPIVLLWMAAVTLRRRQRHFLLPVLFGIVGTLLPILLTLAWVWRKHVLRAFLATLFDLIPYFARLGTRSYAHLILHSVSGVLLPIVVLWLAVILLQPKPLTWERAALLIGVLFGLASFYLQRKGYSYHRYPSEAFLLLLASIDLTAVFHKASRHQTTVQWLALAALLIGTILIGGGSTAHAIHQDWRNREFDALLQADLNRLGGQQLAGRVQCLDMGDGCIPTLYNMRLVQATGFLYDCYMFSPVHTAEQIRYREAFWQAMTRNPPAVFVITSNDCENYPEKPSYHYQKIARWPQLNDFLRVQLPPGSSTHSASHGEHRQQPLKTTWLSHLRSE